MKSLPFFLFFSFLVFDLYSNPENSHFSIPSLTEPSPESVVSASFGFLDTDLYQGLPNISIPLHQYAFEDRALQLSLAYAMPGLKPSEEASITGLGWKLQSGARITRVIKGNDDLGKTNSGRGFGWIYTEALLPTALPASSGSAHWILPPNTESDYLNGRYPMDEQNDLEQDHFFVNLFGSDLHFILGKKPSNSNMVKGKCQNNQLFDIKYDVNSGFIITDPKGFKYYFEKELKSRMILSNAKWNVMSWIINKITSPSGKSIYFKYLFNNPIKIESPSFRREEVNRKICNYDIGPFFPSIPSDLIFDYHFETEENYLSKIESSNLDIKFIYSDRLDLKSISAFNAKKLDAIDIRYKHKDLNGNHSYHPFKRVDFKYDYYRSDKLQSADKHLYLRLKLLGLRIHDQVFSFSYFMDNDVPALPNKESFSFDYWGYFNGQNYNKLTPSYKNPGTGNCASMSYAGPKREADPSKSKYGVLESIKYPTGGLTLFDYEGHQAAFPDHKVYDWENSNASMYPSGSKRNKTVGGLRIKSIKDIDIDGSILSHKSFLYTEENSPLSSGKMRMEDFRYVTFHKIHSCNSSNSSGNISCGGVEYAKISSQAYTGLRSLKSGYHIGYRKVRQKTHNVNNTQYFSKLTEFINEPDISCIGFIRNTCNTHSTINGSFYHITSNSNRSSTSYSRDFKNGLVLNEKYFDEKGQLSKEREFQYSTNKVDYDANMSIIMGSGCGVVKSVDLFTVYANEVKKHLLNRIEERFYYNAGEKEIISDYAYNSKWQKISEAQNNGTESKQSKTFYMDDYSFGTLSNHWSLDSKNIKHLPVKIEEYRNSKFIKGSVFQFNSQGRLASIYENDVETIGINPNHNPNIEIPNNYYESKRIEYWNQSHLVKEIENDVGLKTSILYGYNNVHPIAIISGIGMNNLLQNYQIDLDLINYDNDQYNILYELTALKNALKADKVLMEFALYKPLIGINKKHNSDGISHSYIYDSNNRLKSILDRNMDIISSYSITYPPQNF